MQDDGRNAGQMARKADRRSLCGIALMSIENSSENEKFFRSCFVFTHLRFYGILFSGGGAMLMNGEYLETLRDLKRCFCVDELIYAYISGELEIWLRKIGETERAERVQAIPKVNAYLLLRLYDILDLNPDLSEEEIRSLFTLPKQNEETH